MSSLRKYSLLVNNVTLEMLLSGLVDDIEIFPMRMTSQTLSTPLGKTRTSEGNRFGC